MLRPLDPVKAEPMPRSPLTRLLHATIALAVVAQLVGIGLAEPPSHGAPGNLAFSVHQAVGLGTLGVLVAFWLWTLLRRREHGFTALVPWFSRSRRAAVWAQGACALYAACLSVREVEAAQERNPTIVRRFGAFGTCCGKTRCTAPEWDCFWYLAGA